jgi:hypothetical protein
VVFQPIPPSLVVAAKISPTAPISAADFLTLHRRTAVLCRSPGPARRNNPKLTAPKISLSNPTQPLQLQVSPATASRQPTLPLHYLLSRWTAELPHRRTAVLCRSSGPARRNNPKRTAPKISLSNPTPTDSNGKSLPPLLGSRLSHCTNFTAAGLPSYFPPAETTPNSPRPKSLSQIRPNHSNCKSLPTASRQPTLPLH